MTELRVGHRLGEVINEPFGDDSCPSYDGFCGGLFGRDSYSVKRVEMIGADWVVVRNEDDGKPDFYAGHPNDLARYILGEPL